MADTLTYCAAATSLMMCAGAYTNNLGLSTARTAVAVALAAVGIIAARITGQTYAAMPQGWLFVPVAALGMAALVI